MSFPIVVLLVAGALVGALIGLAATLLVLRSDETWKRLLGTTGGSGTVLGLYKWLAAEFAPEPDFKAALLGAVLVGAILGAAIMVRFLMRQLATQSGLYRVTLLDLIFGYRKMLEAYYKSRSDEIERCLTLGDLAKRDAELLARESKVAEREGQLEVLERQVQEAVEAAEKATKAAPVIRLPIGKSVPVDRSLLERLPLFVENVARYSHLLGRAADSFLAEASEARGRGEEIAVKDLVAGYCLYICECTAKSLLTSFDARVHFRALSGDRYESIACSLGAEEYNYRLTDIPLGRGMIAAAAKVHRSLIKSFNVEFHEVAANDEIWVNYMTLVFPEIFDRKRNVPLITMGISVREDALFRETFVLLNHVRIEKVIQQHLVQFIRQLPTQDLIAGPGNVMVEEERETNARN